jgi:hypothetical protein
MGVTWTWEEIQQEWLRDDSSPADPGGWVDSFNCLERFFGREWINQLRFAGGAERWGLHPTLGVVTQGLRLRSIGDLSNKGRLVEKLRALDQSAWAELTGIWLLKGDDPEVMV